MMPLTLGQQAAQFAGNAGGPLGASQAGGSPFGGTAGTNLIAQALQGHQSQPGVGFAGLGAPNRGPSLIAPPPSFPPAGPPAPAPVPAAPAAPAPAAAPAAPFRHPWERPEWVPRGDGAGV